MRASLLAALALSGSSLVACAVPAPEPGVETTSSAATAIVVVERTAGPGDAMRADAVIARFVRVRQGAVDDPALRIAGVAEDVPSPGSCFTPTDGAPIIQQGHSVELLDVGSVVINSESINSESAARNTVLPPRLMPDPAGVVSGVFYSSKSTDVFAAGGRLALRAGGGPDLVDGFAATVTAPRDVTDVQVASVVAGLDVSWDATESDLHDLVYVDVLSPAPRVAVRCAAIDAAGHLLVPHGSIVGVDEGQLAVHRLHKESFKAKGIEPGEVRFDIARVVTFRR